MFHFGPQTHVIILYMHTTQCSGLRIASEIDRWWRHHSVITGQSFVYVSAFLNTYASFRSATTKFKRHRGDDKSRRSLVKYHTWGDSNLLHLRQFHIPHYSYRPTSK
jgi:hypothetical protein